MRAINEPLIAVGPLYAAKTIELCVPDDPICSSGTDFSAHMQYPETGMVDQAATFTASRLLADSGPEITRSTPAPAGTPKPQRPLPPGTLLLCKNVCQVIGPA
jgi:cutinase